MLTDDNFIISSPLSPSSPLELEERKDDSRIMTDQRYFINLDEWGPAGWKFLHAVSLMYPLNPTAQDRDKYKKFYQLVGSVLPCHTCQEHYRSNLSKQPLSNAVLASPRALSEWLNMMHNQVRRAQGKSELDFLSMVAEYMPLDLAAERLNLTNDEKQRLRILDREINRDYLDEAMRPSFSHVTPAPSPQDAMSKELRLARTGNIVLGVLLFAVLLVLCFLPLICSKVHPCSRSPSASSDSINFNSFN